MDSARHERIEAERALQDWQGLPTPPPYSVLAVDVLRDDVDNADARIASAMQRRELFERFASELAAKAKASQAAARLATERAEGAARTRAYAKLVWARDGAIARARVDEATRELLDMAVRNAREEASAGVAVRDLAVRNLAAAGSDFTLDATDLARIRGDLEARKTQVNRLIEQATQDASLANEARAAAETALARERATPIAPDDDAGTRAEREGRLARVADAKREAAVTAALRVDLLREYLLLLDGEGAAWKARRRRDVAAQPSRGPSRLRKTGGLPRERAHLAAISRPAARHGHRTRPGAGDQGPHEPARRRRRSRPSCSRRIVSVKASCAGRSNRDSRWSACCGTSAADFEGRREVSFLERLKDRGAEGLLRMRRVWNYELTTVDDSYETADGRKLSVSRSVTLGKTAGAVLIVVLGYFLCSFVTRRIERMAVSRGRIAAQSAALLRNWTLFVLTAILVIFALLSASIPLTAFAFLGGALAIAAGFGLQTLLKNFVAGLMILLERPMRLDDLVDVDGIRGRVTAIGIRASTITSADGIESMIPNSAFVENKLTNWTYSSPQSRQTIRVGVAYGTALRKAGDALLDVATRHGLVLKEPAPQVYLDEYARQRGLFRAHLLGRHDARKRHPPRPQRSVAHDRSRVCGRRDQDALSTARRSCRHRDADQGGNRAATRRGRARVKDQGFGSWSRARSRASSAVMSPNAADNAATCASTPDPLAGTRR